MTASVGQDRKRKRRDTRKLTVRLQGADAKALDLLLLHHRATASAVIRSLIWKAADAVSLDH